MIDGLTHKQAMVMQQKLETMLVSEFTLTKEQMKRQIIILEDALGKEDLSLLLDEDLQTVSTESSGELRAQMWCCWGGTYGSMETILEETKSVLECRYPEKVANIATMRETEDD